MSGQPSSASNLWSCASLTDGADYLMGQAYGDDEEQRLLQELQDFQLRTPWLNHQHVMTASCYFGGWFICLYMMIML